MDRAAIIVGTGGFAIEFAAMLAEAGHTVLGFAGPAPDTPLPAAHLGPDAMLANQPAEAAVFIALGEPALRRKLAKRLLEMGRDWRGFVHSAAWVAPGASLGRGAIVYPNATVHAGVALGEGVLVNSNASVGHETRIGAFTTIGPGVALGGRMDIGEEVYIGIGASTLEKLTISSGAVIGAGAAVTRDITGPGTYAGVPAKRLG